MCRKLKILLSMFLFGLFLVPIEVSACVTSHTNHPKEIIKVEKSCCDDSSDGHHNKQSCKKDCCKDNAGDSGCSGNCGHNSCHSSSPTYLIHGIQDSQKALLFGDKKSFPLYKQSYYSSGFHSIWQPPKIA